MSTTNYLAEKLATNAYVYVDGKEVKFVSLILDQAFGQHHTFQITMDYDALKQPFFSNPLEHLNLIGKSVEIELQQGTDNGGAYQFRGIVQDVIHEGKEGKHGYLIIEGLSTTILLERGKRFDVFCEMDLQRVFREVTDGIINKRLSCVNKPVYYGQIPFLMQYNESDWEFLQRLSAISGETLFYTGMDLVFGQYKDWEPTHVSYDKEITSFRFGAKLLANNFTRYQYLDGQNDTLIQDSSERIRNANDYINTAAIRSKELTEKRPVRKPLALNVQDKGSLDELVEREKTSTAASTVYVTGTAKTCAPRIGRLLSIRMPDNMPQANNLGTYRIVKVRHTIDQNHHYECVFEGIPADLKFFPTPDVKIPVAESLQGLVVKNNDPQGQGRICVEFPFAQDRVSETWMRVMTPSAGSSGKVGQNRGMVFIPEVGDQVMVGFEFGDPNRPYVMGSMFHGRNAQGGGNKNTTKSIITRSGIQIVFNDDANSLHIADASGCTWDMDGNGNLVVSTPKKITFTTKDIEINASNNFNINVGNNLLTDVGNTNSMFTKTFKNNVSKDMYMHSNTALISSTLKMQLQSDEVTALGVQKMTLHSDKSFVANSLGLMDLRSSDSMTLAQDATTNTVTATEEVAVAVVQFRQRAADAKLYGFDWIRVKGEAPSPDDTFYAKIVESGVESVTTNAAGETVVTEYADQVAAYTALKKKYNPIPIKRDTAATATQEGEYFVPRMTLFPPNVDKKYASSPASEPKTEVQLELWVEIIKEVEKLELDYDKTIFDISDITLTTKTPSAKAKLTSTITLKCKKEFSSKEEIKVWAYPKPVATSTATPSTTPTDASTAPKFLAGKLMVYPNTENKRKKIRVALVPVKTDWRNLNIPNVFQQGVFPTDVPAYIQYFTNQSLIECTILKKPLQEEEMDGIDIVEDSFLLDMRRIDDYHYQYDVVDFTQTPHKVTKQYGKLISNETEIQQHGIPYRLKSIVMHRDAAGNVDHVDSNSALYNDLKSRFYKKYPNYTDCYLIFAFDLKLPISNLVGQAEGFKTMSSLIIKDCGAEAAAHELLHCIGLAHPFRDIDDTLVLTPAQKRVQKPIAPEQMFIFDKYVQDNIMDYPANNGILKERTWAWQWEELNPNLK